MLECTFVHVVRPLKSLFFLREKKPDSTHQTILEERIQSVKERGERAVLCVVSGLVDMGKNLLLRLFVTESKSREQVAGH